MSTVIEKIKKLLNVTEEKGATPAEAAKALMLAQRLMFKEGLTEADLETPEQLKVDDNIFNTITKTISKHILNLAFALAQHYKCFVYIKKNLASREEKLKIVGRENEAKAFSQILTYAVVMQERCFQEFLNAEKQSKKLNRSQSLRLKNDFCLGFARGMDKQLTDNENQYALVLVRPQQVQDYIDTKLNLVFRDAKDCAHSDDMVRAHSEGYKQGKDVIKRKNQIEN